MTPPGFRVGRAGGFTVSVVGARAPAAVARRLPRPVFVVIAHPRDLDAWAADLLGFSGDEPGAFTPD